MRVNSQELPLPAISLFQLPPSHLGPPRPTLSIKAVLTAPLECSMCPYQRSLLSFSMRSRSSMPSHASSSVDLMVAVSRSFTLHICLFIALPFCCRCWRLSFVNDQVSLAQSIALCTQELYIWPRVLKERWREERTGTSSLNFFQVVFTCVVVESSQPPACRAQIGLPSVVCHLRGVQFPGMGIPVIRVLCQALEPNAFLVHPVFTVFAEDAVAAHSSVTNSAWELVCKRSRPVPQIMIFVFSAFTLSPFSFIASFQFKSFPTHSSSNSAMITRSSA